MGKIRPPPSTYDLVGHRRAEERRNPSSTGSVDRLGAGLSRTAQERHLARLSPAWRGI
jgi:hypothetical protein